MSSLLTGIVCGYLGIPILTALIRSFVVRRRRRGGRRLARLNIEVTGLRQQVGHYERLLMEMRLS